MTIDLAWLPQKIKWLICDHEFDVHDLPAREEDGFMHWPCWKCGKVYPVEYGLAVMTHGRIVNREQKQL